MPEVIQHDAQPKSEFETVLANTNHSMPLRKIEEILERTDLSADVKSIVLDVAKYTVKVGEHVIALGRKLVSFALELAKTIPNTLLGIALALILASFTGPVLAGIPLIGLKLAGFLKSILLLFGLTHGVLADMRTGELANRIDRMIANLSPLGGLTE